MEGFRDKAREGLDRAEEETDERTGGRFDEQTDEMRQRGEEYLGGDESPEEGDGESSAGMGEEQSSFDDDEELDEGEDESPY